MGSAKSFSFCGLISSILVVAGINVPSCSSADHHTTTSPGHGAREKTVTVKEFLRTALLLPRTVGQPLVMQSWWTQEGGDVSDM